jgi:hypothetical protein
LVKFDPDKAPFELAAAIKLDPDDPARLTRAATLMLELGQTEAARSYAARAADLAQEDFVLASDLTNVSGLIAAIRGEDNLAEEALKTAHEMAPGRLDFALELARFLADRDERQSFRGY